MNIFQFCASLGIFYILIALALKPIMLAFIVVSERFHCIKLGANIYKVLETYLYASGTVVVTLIAIQHVSGFPVFVFLVLGMFSLLIVSSTGPSQEKMELEGYAYDDDYKNALKCKHVYALGSIVLYLTGLIFPPVVTNPATELIFKIIAWLLQIPIVGSLLSLAGFIFIIVITVSAFQLLRSFISNFKRKIKTSFSAKSAPPTEITKDGLFIEARCTRCGKLISSETATNLEGLCLDCSMEARPSKEEKELFKQKKTEENS